MLVNIHTLTRMFGFVSVDSVGRLVHAPLFPQLEGLGTFLSILLCFMFNFGFAIDFKYVSEIVVYILKYFINLIISGLFLAVLLFLKVKRSNSESNIFAYMRM